MLGPFLFLLYINDIYLSSDKLKFYLFADDTNILYADKNLKAIEQTVNVELNNVHDWLTTNRLTLNTKKSNFLIFRPRQKKMHFSPQISILDCETNQRVSLEQKSYIKYLGVLIDQNLPWKSHVDSVIVKISKTIGMIAKLRYFVPSTVLVNIYNSLILPYITYGLLCLGQCVKCVFKQDFSSSKASFALNLFHRSKRACHPFIYQSKSSACYFPIL